MRPNSDAARGPVDDVVKRLGRASLQMTFKRNSRSPATGWKRSRHFPELANALERKIDAMVLSDLLPHCVDLCVGTIPNSVFAGLGTLGEYRVGQIPFASIPLADSSITTWKLNLDGVIDGLRHGVSSARQ
jgi:hypothetical protein